MQEGRIHQTYTYTQLKRELFQNYFTPFVHVRRFWAVPHIAYNKSVFVCYAAPPRRAAPKGRTKCLVEMIIYAVCCIVALLKVAHSYIACEYVECGRATGARARQGVYTIHTQECGGVSKSAPPLCIRILRYTPQAEKLKLQNYKK